jgi:putative transposase
LTGLAWVLYRVDMPRTARASIGGMWYHALNRGNRREVVFHKLGDYSAFVEAMAGACERVPVDLLGYCLMPNHFHVVLRPHHDGDLGRWFQWLLTAHARRYHRHYGTTGHVWQGRFQAFPIEDDDHLITVLRYVERNPLRAELVLRAEEWEWSSLSRWQRHDPLLWRGEVPVRDGRWLERVNEPLSAADLQRLRHSVARGRPYGGDSWTTETATRLGLESCLRARGRPRKDNA